MEWSNLTNRSKIWVIGIIYIIITYLSYITINSLPRIFGILGIFFILPAIIFSLLFGSLYGYNPENSPHSFNVDVIVLVFWILVIEAVSLFINKEKVGKNN